MNFNENELFGAALIGFDLIDGPFIKWQKEFIPTSNLIKLEDFAMNFYLAFRGGNAGKKPRAILYDKFYIVAFPQNLELCCLFMKPQGIDRNIKQLNKIATRIIHEMDVEEEDKIDPTVSSDNTIEEMKRIIINLLSGIEMSTPEIRKYFKLSNSQIWKVMSDLENSLSVKRARKEGRTVLWTVN
jgi:hypothetical protein